MAKTKKHIVQIRRSSLLAALKALNMTVVSLDRIGSYIADRSREESDKITCQFLDDWNICRELSNARRRLSEPFSRKIGPDLMDELEREMKDVAYWNSAQQRPPKPRRRKTRKVSPRKRKSRRSTR